MDRGARVFVHPSSHVQFQRRVRRICGWLFRSDRFVLVDFSCKELPRSGSRSSGGSCRRVGRGATKYTGCTYRCQHGRGVFLGSTICYRRPFFLPALSAQAFGLTQGTLFGPATQCFLHDWLTREKFNAYALASYRAVLVRAHISILDVLYFFLFFAGLILSTSASGEFFGPIVVAFAPLLIFAIRRRSGRGELNIFVWVIHRSRHRMRFRNDAIFASSGIAYCIGRGARRRCAPSVVRWRPARFVSLVTIVSFLVLACGLARYD